MIIRTLLAKVTKKTNNITNYCQTDVITDISIQKSNNFQNFKF